MDQDGANVRNPAASARRSGQIQSVARALGILDLVADRPSVRAQEAAKALGLNLTTTVHLLNTLVEGGYLVKDGRTYRWSADKVLALHSRLTVDMNPSQRALEAMHQVIGATGESGYVSCWTGDDVVILAVAEGRQAVRVTGLRTGLRGNIHARSSGKCLLAFGPDSRLDSLLATGPLHKLTPHTIVEAQALREELALTRRRGYSIDREEYIDGVWAVAAPLPETAGPPTTALSVTVPAHRFHTNSSTIIAELLKATSAAAQGAS